MGTRFVLDVDTARAQATGDAADLAAKLGRPPRLQSTAINQDLVDFVTEWFRSVECLERGEFFSRVMRLPPFWRNCVMEYLGGGGPYQGAAPQIQVRIRNIGPNTISILRALVSTPVTDYVTGIKTDRVHVRKINDNLESGSEITLESDLACYALNRHGIYCLPMHIWDREPPKLEDRPLLEVGYSARWVDYRGDGSFNEISSDDWQADVEADCVARANNAGSGAEAYEILGIVKPWWNHSQDYLDLVTRLGAPPDPQANVVTRPIRGRRGK